MIAYQGKIFIDFRHRVDDQLFISIEQLQTGKHDFLDHLAIFIDQAGFHHQPILVVNPEFHTVAVLVPGIDMHYHGAHIGNTIITQQFHVIEFFKSGDIFRNKYRRKGILAREIHHHLAARRPDTGQILVISDNLTGFTVK